MKRIMAVVAALLLGSFLAAQDASAIATNFQEPAFWNVGDPQSTYQEWDAGEAAFLLGGAAPYAENASPNLTSSSTLGATNTSAAGSGGYYTPSNDYEVHANIVNHGGSSGSGASYASNFGTRVMVQTGATLNGDLGVYTDSVQVVQPDGSPIAGGDNADALYIADVSTDFLFLFSFGLVPLQEQIFEFWLPGYTDDFRIEFDSVVHSSFQQLRVDTLIMDEVENANFNGDSSINGDDFLVWQRGHGSDGLDITFGTDRVVTNIEYLALADGDANLDYSVDGDDLNIWRNQYGSTVVSSTTMTIPEPSGLVIANAGLLLIVGLRRSRNYFAKTSW